jgi:predicted Rdx family selenoprotein
VRTVRDLLGNYQHVIERLTLHTGGAGVFDVVVDGELLWSKKAAGRHAEAGEVLATFVERHARDIPIFER